MDKEKKLLSNLKYYIVVIKVLKSLKSIEHKVIFI